MASFPAGTRVSTPAGTVLGGECLVVVRVARPEELDGDALRARYGSRLYALDLTEETLTAAERLETIADTPVRIRLSNAARLEAPGLADRLGALRAAFLIPPGEGLLKDANFLTSLGFPVRIDSTAEVAAPAKLGETLEFYLHNPLLGKPIEPFHSLLAILARGASGTLWECEAESTRRDFYVTEGGEITLARRWAGRGEIYGTIDDPWDDIIGSELYLRLASFKRELFRTQSPCALCEHFDLCAGFLRATEPERSCDAWQQVFSRLRGEVRRARELLAGPEPPEEGAAAEAGEAAAGGGAAEQAEPAEETDSAAPEEPPPA